MALFRKFFYKKPPDGLLEITESVYVFDYCFTTNVLEEDEYKVYISGIVGLLHDHFLDSSFMVFNFREGDNQSQIASILVDYDMLVMEYPRQYEGCPILTMETIHHFLRSSESWLQLGQSNLILMHCERGGWPVLAFMLAALLIYRKKYTGEQKTLDMIYKQAPRELLQLMSPLNPLPSQLRYLQYVSRRNVGSEWPPLDRALTLDCIIIRSIPNVDGEGGCRPIFRIYGQDPFMAADRTPKVLFSTPKRSKLVRHYKQDDCELVKIDIHCHVQGDVVLECISLDSDLEHEQMVLRVMFNTAFIRSNILMLNRDEIDTLWNGKDQFPKDFRVEVLFSEMDTSSSVISIDMPQIGDKEGLPIEAFARVQEIFNNVDWLDSRTEVANVLQQISASNMLLERLDNGISIATSSLLKESLSGRFKSEPKTPESMTAPIPEKQSNSSFESSMDACYNMNMKPLESKVLSENNIQNHASPSQGKQFISLLELSADSDSAEKIISSESKASLENDTEGHTLMTKVNESIPLVEPPMDTTLMKKNIEALESKALSRNDTKCVTSMGDRKQSTLLIEPSIDANSMKTKIKPLESTTLSENDTGSLTSMAQAKESIPSYEPPVDATSIKKRIEPLEPKALSVNDTKSLTSTAQTKDSIPSYEPSLDANSLKKRIEPQDLQVSLQLATQSKIISPRVDQASRSAPVLYCSSLQGSSVPISRYHSAPSALGITALLQDHAKMDTKEEVNHGVTMSPPPSTLSPSLLEVPKSIESSLTNVPSVSSSALLQSLARKSSMDVPAVASSSPLEPHPTLELMQPTITEHLENTMCDKSKKSLVSPPEPQLTTNSQLSQLTAIPLPLSSLSSFSSPPSLPPTSSPSTSFPGTSPRCTVKSSLIAPPAPPPPPQPTSVLLSPSSMKSSFSTLSSPSPAPPPSSFPLTSYSTLRDSIITPPPLVPDPPPALLPASSLLKSSISTPPLPPPAPPPPSSSPGTSLHSNIENSFKAPPRPPPPPSSTIQTSSSITTPPHSDAHPNPSPMSMNNSALTPGPPPPPPPPGLPRTISGPTLASPVPPPPPPPSSASQNLSKTSATAPPVPPPPFPTTNRLLKVGTPTGTGNGNVPPVPGPPSAPFGAKGPGLLRSNAKLQNQTIRSNLKPYHWLKLTRVMHGSLWAETQKPDEASKAPEFDMSELESLFSANTPNSASKGGKSKCISSGTKAEKVQLIDLRRAYNCEIMLTKVKIPLPDLMSSVLALDESALDVDQVENLIKFCPTKDEMELLKNYNGDKDNLGKCEQFFLELMNVPRVESKLRVFSFKIQFRTQVSELRCGLNIVNSASAEIRNSVKLKRIMQTILSLGNALNHGTARGSAIGFRLDSLLKLTETRARNNKMTLMHYLCKVIAEKLPELLDFSKDLGSLEASAKIQLKYLAEEMQAISKGLEKVVQELTASENDGPVSESFSKILKEFLCYAEAEVRSLAQLYSNVGRHADALAQYFGEDPARCPFEQVVSTLLNFVKMFVRAHEDNCKQIEFEKKKALKEAEHEKLKLAPKKESERMIRTPISGNIE